MVNSFTCRDQQNAIVMISAGSADIAFPAAFYTDENVFAGGYSFFQDHRLWAPNYDKEVFDGCSLSVCVLSFSAAGYAIGLIGAFGYVFPGEEIMRRAFVDLLVFPALVFVVFIVTLPGL